jgi:hypothetical protein
MFKFDELEELKKHALEEMDAHSKEAVWAAHWAFQVMIYQNEQILRELKSSGWKLKVLSEK